MKKVLVILVSVMALFVVFAATASADGFSKGAGHWDPNHPPYHHGHGDHHPHEDSLSG